VSNRRERRHVLSSPRARSECHVSGWPLSGNAIYLTGPVRCANGGPSSGVMGRSSHLASVDCRRSRLQNHRVSTSFIVLNGPSSSGKSTIAAELQKLWPRPLWVTGLDALIAGWPDSYVTVPGDDGTPAAPSTGLRVVPGVGPDPSWILEIGEDFHAMSRLSHESWALMGRAGMDLLIDHVTIDATLRDQARSYLAAAFWVGVTCDVDELVRREIERGDRHIGFASGSFAVVHNEMTYDLMVDTTFTSSGLLAQQIFDAVMGIEPLDVPPQARTPVSPD
jgi:chloramphenicol 3-O phosphotransferase